MREDLQCIEKQLKSRRRERKRESATKSSWNWRMYLTNVSIDYAVLCLQKGYSLRRLSKGRQKDKKNRCLVLWCCMHIKTNMDIGCGIMWALQSV